ncbi:phage terminase small subunit [Clostridium sp. HBUAS56010]|uniref:phage terminase small subunit n=1 Tax=Clostridium sp. HBUAS56010 TaxID=2571127 RepID=UPI001177742A|nr:phage terminase small subunit [Clostridium sp. HBUAS56010]
MARAPDERIEQAKAMYLKGLKLVEIASQLNLPEGTVRRWKSTHKWESERSDKKSERSHKKGPPRGNKNAVGNKGGAAPENNRNAEKHGLFSKYLPPETLEIVNNMTINPLDILWDQIQIAYAAIIRAQQIMYVKDQEDKTIERIERKDGNVFGEKWEVQQAWDKQASFMQAQARAQSELRSMIKQYDEMLHKDWEIASEEQKARIAQIKAQTDKLTGNNSEIEDIEEIEGDIYGSE